jgi:alpha-glucoside transport system substrate-binding protein
MGKRLWTTAVFVVVIALIVAACSSTGTPAGSAASATAAATASGSAAASPSGSAGTPAPSQAAAVPKVPTGYAELDKALGSDKPYNKKTVSFQTQWIGSEGAGFAAAFADFAKATGMNIQVDSIGSSHETVLKTRIEGNKPPDMAMLAQPTGVLAYAAQGKVTDLATFMSPDEIKKLTDEHESTIGLVTQGNQVWGIPYKADVKSIVWYPIKAFAAKGYQVPKTFDELVALSDKIVADGSHPWCVSAGDVPGTNTGWQITDWIEEVILKTHDLQFYNDWISHKITFQDPAIKAAFDKVGSILFKDGYVDGGGQAITNTDGKVVMDPMFNDDMANPGCWMQKVPTWYGPGFFPDQRSSGQPSKFKIGEDVGLFPFPTVDPNFLGVEGSADTIMVLVDRPEVRAFAEFLALPEGIQGWILGGNAVSPAISANGKTPAEWYAGNYSLNVAAETARNAKYIGFDASDLMPPSVGGGSFWKELVSWCNANGQNTDEVLKNIDESWPSS